MDPKQLAPVLSNVTASADKLAACPTVKEALAAILRDEKITLADQIAITEVEAPPFHEDERAKDLVRRFQALGLTDVTIDQEGNVIARRPGTGNGPRSASRYGVSGRNGRARSRGKRHLSRARHQ